MSTNSHQLFPIDLPESEWVEFNAEGFSKPVTGVIYRDGAVERGVPLGGLGTGFIALGTDGTLDYYTTIFNAFMERHDVAAERTSDWGPGAAWTRSVIPSLCLPFLGLAVAGKTYVHSLQEVDGVEKAKQIHYWGHYPVADVEYEINAPLRVGLRAWTPFYPGDAAGSNIPGAVFQVHRRNCATTSSAASWPMASCGCAARAAAPVARWPSRASAGASAPAVWADAWRTRRRGCATRCCPGCRCGSGC